MSPRPLLRILHVITGLEIGGAEIMLVQLVERWQKEGHSNHVVSLLPGGRLVGRLQSAGAEVTELGLRRGYLPSSKAWRLREVFRAFRPDITQGWMYHANLAAQVGRLMACNRLPLFWTIHFTPSESKGLSRLTKLVIHASALSSLLTTGIIYCSSASASQHEALGYARRKTRIIPNGIDTDRFKPDPLARRRLTAALGLPIDRPIVGHFARFDPMKNHFGLLRAVATLRMLGASVHLLLAGSGVDQRNIQLQRAITEFGLQEHVTLLGERDDIESLMPGLDLFVLPSSYGEAFPLVLGEAMAAGVPAVATDLGDCRWIIGDCGSVIGADRPEELVAVIRHQLTLDEAQRATIVAMARRRVIQEFSLTAVSKRYIDHYNAAARSSGCVANTAAELPQCVE